MDDEQSEVQVHDFEDVDLHRYKCKLCDKMFYYSEAAREYYEDGKTSGVFGLGEAIHEATKLADRREALGKAMNTQKLRCPKCDTRQLQLLYHIDRPAKWRCRHCKHTFIDDLNA